VDTLVCMVRQSYPTWCLRLKDESLALVFQVEPLDKSINGFVSMGYVLAIWDVGLVE